MSCKIRNIVDFLRIISLSYLIDFILLRNFRKGVAFVIGKRIINSVLSYWEVYERHMTLKVSGRARNILIHQIYAPNMDDDYEEVEKLYRSIDLEGKRQKEWKDID